MDGSVFFFVNGKPFRISGPAIFETVANFLRYRLCATGTKIVCEEGDCGACSVLVGRIDGDGLSYRPINACIQFLYQIHGTHVVTVEGLGSSDELHPVQDAMVRCHGAQCGYCTPGFIVAMCAMYESPEIPTARTIRTALTGNLCRCTGYEPIIQAGLSVDRSVVRTMAEMYPAEPMLPGLREQLGRPLLVEYEGRKFFAPTTVDEAVRFRSDHPGTVIVQGGTDVVVQHNKRGFDPPVVMNLSNVPELGESSLEGGVLSVGATVTLAQLDKTIRDLVPEFGTILELFGAPQIRYAGTLAGNVANASPIADSLPFLYVMDAKVELAGIEGRREVPIASFYLGYKKLDLRHDEIITRILIPLPDGVANRSEVLKLYKVSKRKHLDISTLTAAIRMSVSGGNVERPVVVYGGVGPTVLRLGRTESFLDGRAFSFDTFRSAGRMAREEISPISDVRGTAAFRGQLAENIMLKFYYECAAEGVSS
ncbi:MAG TPA: FAD binding domain-containing protein [Thermoanaerobaculia bacterium]|nr:FAD binding domain-containing protein [Thermoanaerobaculia bacterium]